MRAQAALEEVREMNYRAWSRPPLAEDESLRMRAAGPHGAFVEVFLDPMLTAALASMETLTAWPVGAVAVAEGYDDEVATEPSLYSIGNKQGNGWIWAQVDGDGTGLAYGRPDDCISCHFSGMDRIFSVDLPAVEDE
jgi:hypothetical protein